MDTEASSSKTVLPQATSAPIPGTIKSGDHVLIKLPSGDIKTVQVHDKPKKVNLGKFGSFNMSQLIGHPFGLSYEILRDGDLKVRKPEPMEDLEDTSATNQLITDGKFVQPLTFDEIETLKKTPGVHSSDIIKMQIDQNTNYEMRTEFSKDKYKKRKEAKFSQGFSVLEPTMFNICEYQFARDPQRIRGIRCETLAQIMSFGNVRPGARVVIIDETGGLFFAAAMDRMGGEGRILTITDADSPPTYFVADNLNLDPREMDRTVSWLSWAEVEEDYVPVAEMEADRAMWNDRQKRKREDRQAKLDQLRARREELWAGEWDGLLVATEYDPFSVVEKLVPYLAGSANIVVHSPYLQVLADAHQKMRPAPQYLGASITEAWLRQYQVLPGRTHPMMSMSGSGGYLLTATKVYNDASATSVFAQQGERRALTKLRKAMRTPTGAAPATTSVPLNGQLDSTVESTATPAGSDSPMEPSLMTDDMFDD
ncbi:tRNA (adenine(58)-N(1))-methyltransferase non-catalytic subunit trm6 [Tulasnella sp. 330]|nr:tRNA (adenine(58)-N(1))-methyltransferase non-catalytic subunit trm6 [Tulasnella sp. 330]KAG8876707.1 tRNA (adenine(58)-N(1))-methyltransferase non-catalytic subunit trm6 [Tulasnella sp. 331]KAG8887366.1 tRNA (adenine(58)-N(1))-methyltransferase non-catalytic subunit trm6 [Tulasnella sp. 332]